MIRFPTRTTMSAQRLIRLLPIAATFALGACGSVPRGGGYYQDDGPHERPPVDVLKVPDAEPRDEPLSSSGNKRYSVFGVDYTPATDARGYRERGVASWYGKKFHGRRTSSGEPYDMYGMSAAHRTLPLPSYVRVRNLQNGRSVVVRVNDRGPFLQNRLIDLSYSAAARLGVLGTGTAMVEVEHVGPATAPVTTLASGGSGASLIAVAEAANAPTAAGPRLSVQVGAFAQQQNAVNLRERLERAGFGPLYIQSPVAGATTLYRVKIGPIGTVERGDQIVAEVARHGVNDALLIVE
jgi:rare lipoprotein A